MTRAEIQIAKRRIEVGSVRDLSVKARVRPTTVLDVFLNPAALRDVCQGKHLGEGWSACGAGRGDALKTYFEGRHLDTTDFICDAYCKDLTIEGRCPFIFVRAT